MPLSALRQPLPTPGSSPVSLLDLTETDLIRKIRRDLPAEVFRSQPWRLIWAAVLIGLIVGASLLCVHREIPVVLRLLLALVCGQCYGALMFLAHEVGHGAIVRSRKIQDVVLAFGGAIFLITPHLWRAWHHAAHHAHTNVEGADPDSFGLLDDRDRGPWERFLLSFTPGSGRVFSFLFLPIGFILHGQLVLWHRSQTWTNPRFSRLRAAAGSLGLALGWISLAIILGSSAIFVVLIPMLTANLLTMGYIVTNHWVRPLRDRPQTLATTVSVKTWSWLDAWHFHFSHHVEHHLFPSLGSNRYPLIRDWLLRHGGLAYVCPSHLRALWVTFATPRLYHPEGWFAETLEGSRVTVSEVDRQLHDRPEVDGDADTQPMSIAAGLALCQPVAAGPGSSPACSPMDS